MAWRCGIQLYGGLCRSHPLRFAVCGESGDTEAAAGIYENAIKAVPDSLLLHLAYADLQEKR